MFLWLSRRERRCGGVYPVGFLTEKPLEWRLTIQSIGHSRSGGREVARRISLASRCIRATMRTFSSIGRRASRRRRRSLAAIRVWSSVDLLDDLVPLREEAMSREYILQKLLVNLGLGQNQRDSGFVL